MTVQYVKVNAISELFAPAVRAFGNIAVVGDSTNPTDPNDPNHIPNFVPIDPNTPVAFTNPADALATFPGDLGNSIAVAFRQSPGPSLVYGVRTDLDTNQNPDWAAALTAVESLDVQLVTLANTPLDAARQNESIIVQLANHVTDVSNTGGDGKERMGVAMLASGDIDPSIVQNTIELANERMVYIAHRSTDDAAAAVAGVIAGYEPHISILLKPVYIDSDPFTSAEIAAINGTGGDQGVNWLVDPVLIPGGGVYMGEGYTGNSGGGKKYIDIVRTMDDVSFRLKAQLIRSIGSLRISRSGLRALIAQMEAVLQPLVRREVIEGYEIVIPVLVLLDKDPASLTAAELQQINDVQSSRVVEVMIAVDYAGAIHRLVINLKFV